MAFICVQMRSEAAFKPFVFTGRVKDLNFLMVDAAQPFSHLWQDWTVEISLEAKRYVAEVNEIYQSDGGKTYSYPVMMGRYCALFLVRLDPIGEA